MIQYVKCMDKNNFVKVSRSDVSNLSTIGGMHTQDSQGNTYKLAFKNYLDMIKFIRSNKYIQDQIRQYFDKSNPELVSRIFTWLSVVKNNDISFCKQDLETFIKSEICGYTKDTTYTYKKDGTENIFSSLYDGDRRKKIDNKYGIPSNFTWYYDFKWSLNSVLEGYGHYLVLTGKRPVSNRYIKRISKKEELSPDCNYIVIGGNSSNNEYYTGLKISNYYNAFLGYDSLDCGLFELSLLDKFITDKDDFTLEWYTKYTSYLMNKHIKEEVYGYTDQRILKLALRCYKSMLIDFNI